MEAFANEFDALPGRVLKPGQATYAELSKTWAVQRNLQPQMVLYPHSVQELRDMTKLLYSSSPRLDFVVRNGGVGSASSKDVVINLAHLKSIEFDEPHETVLVEAGALWEDVDEFMTAKASGWAVVCSRTPFVGVAGIVAIGGVSWLSHEFGLISDPQNLLDVEMVLRDGRLVWASEEDPDLLWAVRAGRSAFGVVSRLKLRARRVKTKGLFAGQIRYPMSKLQEVSIGISEHVKRNKDPKVAFHAFILNPKSPFFDSPPGVALLVYDGHGAEHGRSAEGFGWAYQIEGAEDQTGEFELFEVNNMSAHARPAMGLSNSYDATGLVEEIDPDFLVRACDWFYKVLDTDQRFAAGSYCLVEFTQRACFDSSQNNTAWPHSGHKHILQLGVGFMPGAGPDLTDQAIALLKEAFQKVPKVPSSRGDFAPTFWEPNVMDLRAMYGDNLEKIAAIGKKHDPELRFRSLLKMQPV